MAFADHYLARHAVTDKINTPPSKDLRQIIVIPCHDEPALVQSLESLWSCEHPSCAVEVIIVINSADNASDEVLASNMETLQKARQWINNHHEPGFMFHIIHEPSMPARYAGPGLARKTGMDQAVFRFNMPDNPHGIIISFDADTTCRYDYLKEIESCFSEDQDIKGCTVYFEHPVKGKQYTDTVYRAITEYELHLRYYIEAIRYTGFPHACHTIGSAFCVSASAYVSQGGMNKRRAGEDFYFLQKIVPSGRFAEINTTCVYPSPRPSGRVPFGTGAVVKKYAEGRIKGVDTYHPDAFHGLTVLFSNPSAWFRMKPAEIEKSFNNLPETIQDFAGHEFRDKITEINNNCSGPESFTKRFWHWFNMFKIMKYLNFVHQKYFTKIPVREAASMFLERKERVSCRESNVLELLLFFRRLQRER